MLILQYKTTFVNFALTASNVNYFQLALEILHISYCLYIPSFKVKLANRVKLFSAQMYYNFLSYKCGFCHINVDTGLMCGVHIYVRKSLLYRMYGIITS